MNLHYRQKDFAHHPADQQYYEYYGNITVTNEIKYSIRIFLIYYNVLLFKYYHWYCFNIAVINIFQY